MDEYTTDLFVPRESSPPRQEPETPAPATPPRPQKPEQTPDSEASDTSPTGTHRHHKGLRGRVAGLAKSGIQDRLVEKYAPIPSLPFSLPWKTSS